MGHLVAEAREIVSLGQSLRVIDTPCQVLYVDTSERVGFANVTPNVEELRVLESCGIQINSEVGNGVFVANSALVPIGGNTLIARSIFEALR